MVPFSDRLGVRPVREALQVDSADAPLRTALWNGAVQAYFGALQPGYPLADVDPLYGVITGLWMHVMGRPIDDLPYYCQDIQQAVKEYFFECRNCSGGVAVSCSMEA
jgi:hypothetical protein